MLTLAATIHRDLAALKSINNYGDTETDILQQERALGATEFRRRQRFIKIIPIFVYLFSFLVRSKDGRGTMT